MPPDAGAQQLFGPIPTVHAMLVCEKIISEAGTNMKTLVNVFDMIQVVAGPGRGEAPPAGGPTSPPGIRPHGFQLYARLYDAAGRYVFRVDFVHAEDERRIGQAITQPVEIPDPMAAFDLAMAVPMFQFPKLGRYEFRLYANDVYVAHIPVRVVERGQGGQ